MSTIAARRPQAQKMLPFNGYPQTPAQYRETHSETKIENTPGPGHNGGPGSGNWVAISRDIEKHPVVGFGQPVKPANPKRGSYSRAEAWQSLLFMAQYRPGEVENKGRVILLNRGQLMAGLHYLADRWNWTIEAVRWFLRKIEQASMAISTLPTFANHHKQNPNTKANTVKVLTISNYDIYQVALEIDTKLNTMANPNPTPSAPQESNKVTKKQEDKSPIGDSSVSASAEPEEEPKKGLKPTEAARMAMERYNEIAARCGLSIAKRMTPSRQKAICARIREAGGMSGFEVVLANLEKSAFLQGNNDNGWKADFDFVCQAKSFARLMDGSYGNGAHAKPEARSAYDELYSGVLY